MLLSSMPDVARTIVRVPLVSFRILMETPAAWAPTFAAVILIGAAWWHDNTDQASAIPERVIEVLACLFGLAILLWLFHAGRCPWDEGDWKEEWTYLTALSEGMHHGAVPYYLRTSMLGTERFFANLQTPMVPYAFLLAFVSIRSFFLLHMALVYLIGFYGAVTLKRELELHPLSWTIFLLLFTLNGHIVAHLSVGHLPWASYYLLPWVFVSAVRTSRGDRSLRNAGTCAATLAGMIIIGGWHVFVWSFLFMVFACLVPPNRIVVLAQISLMVALLAAIRLLPALITFGGGTNAFLGGFPTVSGLLASLVTESTLRTDVLDPWEFDTYIGYVGFLVLCLGAVPFRQRRKRSINVLLLPTCALVVLSIGDIYGRTLFHLPGFVSERVSSRMLIVPVLWLLIAGCLRIDSWWLRFRRSFGMSVAVLFGAWFLVLQLVLRAQGWRPHAGVTLQGLPTDVVKSIPVERPYFWAFWCGVGISVAAVFALALVFVKKTDYESDRETGLGVYRSGNHRL